MHGSRALARPSGLEYKRMMFVRDPTHRAVSGFHQMAAHYLLLYRLSPSKAASCLDQWPEDIDRLQGAIGHLHGDCYNAYMIGLDGVKDNQMTIMTRNASIATKDSALLEHLWYLPKGCHFRHGTNMSKTFTSDTNLVASDPEKYQYADPWVCSGDDCRSKCEISDQTYAELFSHALSDAAKVSPVGCSVTGLFAGEHMWPQIYHLWSAGRADYTLRLETLE